MAKIIIACLLILLTIWWLYGKLFRRPSNLETINLDINGRKYSLEIARSINEKMVGLSNRKSLCPDCGMIFVYSRPGTLPFWMKDTLIPLDMIWLDQSGKIVHLVTAPTQINEAVTKLKTYQNSIPAQYVIELNAGTADKLELKPGSQILLPPNL